MLRVALLTLPLVAVLLIAEPARAFERPNEDQHAVGPRYDVGGRGSAVGAGYMYFRGIAGNSSLVAAGTDVKAYVGSFERLHGGSFIGVGRITMGGGGHGGCRCSTVELGFGPLVTPRGTKGVGHLGVYISVFTFVDLGYSYQFPIATEQPSWLSSHQFSARIHVPIAGKAWL